VERMELGTRHNPICVHGSGRDPRMSRRTHIKDARRATYGVSGTNHGRPSGPGTLDALFTRRLGRRSDVPEVLSVLDAPMSSGGRRAIAYCVDSAALVVQEPSIDLI